MFSKDTGQHFLITGGNSLQNEQNKSPQQGLYFLRFIHNSGYKLII